MKTVAEVLRAGKWQEAPAALTPARVLCRRDCSVCGGVGYVRYDVPMGHPYFGKAQPCPKIPPESSLHENHGLTIKEIQSLDWSNLVVRENVQEGISVVKEYISRGSGMIYIYGGPGLAKTVLLKIACAIWARSGSGVFLYTTQKEMIDDIRLGYNDREEPHRAVREKEEKYINFSLLAVDEITTERGTDFKIEEMFHVINKRHEAGVEYGGKFVTLMVGNIPPSRLDYRIVDRLSDGRNKIVKLTGESYRPVMEWQEEKARLYLYDPRTGERLE